MFYSSGDGHASNLQQILSHTAISSSSSPAATGGMVAPNIGDLEKNSARESSSLNDVCASFRKVKINQNI
ncbi:hypothetical protein DPEC_G00220520 [Dallia pectoralis]|uniref:Uncharacterized protein n=1 Tax=Dallia pectoralis TaxID=75939 RepID=A0ACC2G436_DALPE|nr:hypothetical protein DPEC_G00220520 [Dallia pectoralis]